ncbi:ADP-heptose--lipooligosaccharide heptosyltransferase II [hydrothermal vent metagenome]|uniref:lipopolysaccharide heptosyltransferase II n=1 Tax=hydrothermal vent metagenome TaxID=652676 RepID=A0A3B1BNG1_9ZZZZ
MPNWLGDSVMAIPAIKSLKAMFDDCKIDIIINESLSGLGELLTATIEKTIALPENDASRRKAVLAGAAKSSYDLLIILPNSFRSAWELWSCNIGVRAGYAASLRSFILTHAIKRPTAHSMSQSDYFLNLVKELYPKIEAKDMSLTVPDTAVKSSIKALPRTDRPMVGVGFGAAYGSAKMWPADRFAELIDRLEEVAVVVLIGSKSDRAVADKVLDLTKSSPASLVGKTDIPALSAVLSRLDLYITNDTGPMHLASAVGTSVIAIFGPTSPEETGPIGENHHVICHKADCAPCWRRICPLDHRCMESISVDEALETALRLLP